MSRLDDSAEMGFKCLPRFVSLKLPSGLDETLGLRLIGGASPCGLLSWF
jgi:hypothetical protein